QHVLRVLAHGRDAAGHLVDRDDRRLVDHDPFSAGVHAGIGRPEIDGEVTLGKRKDPKKTQSELPVGIDHWTEVSAPPRAAAVTVRSCVKYRRLTTWDQQPLTDDYVSAGSTAA